ncbi:helix-turn-helix transcriptional regulator [Microcoleus sp. FACHB-1515]|uniref:helix-turn-helix transcriptional regulator n=1 Tax=Cyanophyceae TaxID=3028117 RepID=UPI001686A973|nr:AraC family transcriptional regulator [Microcoleus sp. FACHB-1515]MBD2091502.1 helix-turn-helix transcriptional regulator [Microcoleus sp. FACHB-1515]
MQQVISSVEGDRLHQEFSVCPSSIEPYESLEIVPADEGRGYVRWVELATGIDLDISDHEYFEDCRHKEFDHEHLIQFSVALSGRVITNIYPAIDSEHCYLSGSGISHGYINCHPQGERLRMVDVHIEPEQLQAFFADGEQDLVSEKLLIRSNEWKASFFPKVTPAIRSIAQQIIDAPFRGGMKRLYLQAKVFELLTLQLDAVLSDRTQALPSVKLKADTIARLHHAKEILTAQLENPPALLELAQQVGLSDRTLQRGFKLLFDSTVVGYLAQRRMERAEQLLRQGDRSVAEVANLVGFSHLGNFAAAFKRQFGITPSQCLAGKLAVFGS